MTAVERDTRRILSHAVVHERTWDALQTLVDTAPPALQTLVDTAPPAPTSPTASPPTAG